MAALSILLLGDGNRPEFRNARACLDRWATVATFSDPDSAAAALAEGRETPDVIVVAQAFPGQFSHAAVDRLRRLAPLARILGLMGSWCEGEMRTGSPWPGVVRTYWHQWVARGSRELRRLACGQIGSWALPVTATEEERLLVDTTEPRSQQRGLAVLHSRSSETAEWLSAACRSRGLATIWRRETTTDQVRGAAAGIFDGSDLSENECEELHDLVVALHPAPIIVLLAFPRIDQYERALSVGATAVLSKPPAVEDLFWELDRVVGETPTVRS